MSCHRVTRPHGGVVARTLAGHLPSRDAKVLRKALAASAAADRAAEYGGPNVSVQNNPKDGIVHAVPFGVHRAYFGGRIDGSDREFAGGEDELTLPFCHDGSDDMLVQKCTAIVALHPDEATGAAVETAVRRRLPFVVVPCCVFARLFPHRKTPQGDSVGSRDELTAYLKALHPNVQTKELPFKGANVALFASFD